MSTIDFVKVVGDGIVCADTATKLGEASRRSVVVCGSHGGRYPAYLAICDQVGAIILNDAGVGLAGAGIEGLALCERHGVAAASVSHDSCRIGDAAHMWTHGVISHANSLAEKCGVAPGDPCEQAANQLRVATRLDAEQPGADSLRNSTAPPLPVEKLNESRRVITGGKRPIVLIDSASLVRAEDAGSVIVTASHGGLVGGQAMMAIQVAAHTAVFNDAGVGCDQAGIARLGVLDRQGIIGITVAHTSAKIGDAESMLATGVISHVNQHAESAGLRLGDALSESVRDLAGAAVNDT